MNKSFRQSLLIVAAVSLLTLGGIYAYSYAFKNKTVSEAVPASSQGTPIKRDQSIASAQQSATPQASPMPTPTVAAPSPVVAPQQQSNATNTIATGSFRSAPGERAAGTVHIIKVDDRQYVRFESDTDIGPSPDPIVTFGNGDRADLSINLGSLKGTKGSQNYEIPSSVDFSKYSQVIIYCRSFHVPIGFADIK